MKFAVEAASDANPAELKRILEERGVSDAVQIEPWCRGIELSGDGDLPTAERTLRAAAEWAGPGATLVTLRIEREEVDLLYLLPCADFEAALAALPADVESFQPRRDDWLRNWFRGRWTGMEEEYRLTAEELRAASLTAERILDLLDPAEHRDWRPVQSSLERRATCADLVQAMELAATTTQRRRLAHLFTLRPRPCAAAIPHLIRWLGDPDEQVALDAADGLGVLLTLIGSPQRLAAAQRAAGPPLFDYAQAHPVPFVLTALGVTAHPPARAYLEDLAADAHRPQLREYAVRALRNFDWYASPRNAGTRPPFWTESPDC
ncbi:MAG: hypothetical protein J2P43_13325 [Candidatus Dormibacteraeota bacterium]|nr:hypothetical protein [Candidatus Dormibacteraeota bacterium]